MSAGRKLALLAASGVLAAAGVTAGTAAPAKAGPFVGLSANPTFLLAGEETVLTAPRAGGGFHAPLAWIYIFDTTTGALICQGVNTEGCHGTETQSVATTHEFVAYLVGTSQTNGLPLTDVEAVSTPVTVTWEPVHIIP